MQQPRPTAPPQPFDVEYAVHELRKATRVLSCVMAYQLDYPDGPPQRSDWNQYVQNFKIDPITMMSATERVAEMVEDLHQNVCDPTGS